MLNLVYNPQGAVLPPAQGPLEADYKRELLLHFGIRFDQLFALANMPIQRFGSTLVSKGTFHDYMALLRQQPSRREPADGHVPDDAERRLPGRPVRLRLQPDAEAPGPPRMARPGRTCATC